MTDLSFSFIIFLPSNNMSKSHHLSQIKQGKMFQLAGHPDQRLANKCEFQWIQRYVKRLRARPSPSVETGIEMPVRCSIHLENEKTLDR